MQAESLALRPGAPVFRVRNLLSLGGSAVIVDDLTLPVARLPGPTARRFRDRPSTIYNLYQDGFGISVVRTNERVRAVGADAGTAKLLDIRRSTPLLQIRRVALSYRDDPVEYRVLLVDTNRHGYFVEIGSTA